MASQTRQLAELMAAAGAIVTTVQVNAAYRPGRVPVASDVGGHKELIRHGETGILFKAGRRFVEEERNWTRSVANYQSAYAGVLHS